MSFLFTRMATNCSRIEQEFGSCYFVTNFRIIELFSAHQFFNSMIREFYFVTNLRIIELFSAHQLSDSPIRVFYFCHEFKNSRIFYAHQFSNSIIRELFSLSRIGEFENFFFLFVSALALFQACSFIGICHLDVTNSPSKIRGGQGALTKLQSHECNFCLIIWQLYVYLLT